jgi:glutamine synthetase
MYGNYIEGWDLIDNHSAIADENGLTDTAKKIIAGYLLAAESITAFGNTVPTSFLRLVPHQEAPTSICWGARNRSVLVRVPLGWTGTNNNMLLHANPLEPKDSQFQFENNQTIELRSPDGSANIYFLLASIAIAARHGLEHPDALAIAEQLHIQTDASKIKDLKQLPASCWEAADCLLRDRSIYEADGVFPSGLIDAQIKNLKAFNDLNLNTRINNGDLELKPFVDRFLHCG